MKKFLIFILFATLINTACSNKTLNIMSFNVRVDVAADAPNTWKNRLPIIAEQIRQNGDIVGAQELLGKQYDEIKNELSDFEISGRISANGKTTSEFNGILYKKNKFEILEKGTFGLSPTPDVIGGKGWDAEYERSANWLKLKVRNTNKVFYFFNTHLDVSGIVAQREGAKLLLKKIEEIAGTYPSILTGDFNATENSEAIKIITDKNNPQHLINAAKVSPVRKGANYTFQAFGKISANQCSTIDFIFVKNGVNVKTFETLDKHGDIYASDHFAIKAKISL